MQRLAPLTVLLALALAGCAGSANRPLATAETSSQTRTATLYYLHRTMRCASCTMMERKAQAALQAACPDELAAGRVRWQSVDIQQQPQWAQRYGVINPALVLVTHVDAQEVAHRKLDEAWTAWTDDQEFRALLAQAVQQALAKEATP